MRAWREGSGRCGEPLTQREHGSPDEREDDAADDEGTGEALAPDLVERRDEGGDGDDDGALTQPVDGPGTVALGRPDDGQRQRDAGDAHREVDGEDPAPAQRVGQHPADQWPGRGRDTGDRPPEPERPRPGLRGGIDLLQQRQRPRHEQRRTDALDDAHHGQDGLVGGQHAAQRGEREDAHAEAEDAPVPPAVAQRPAEQEESGEGHRVAVDDPLEVGQRDRQVASDGGRGDVHDRDVEDDHEVAGADGDQRRQTDAPDLASEGGCADTGTSFTRSPTDRRRRPEPAYDPARERWCESGGAAVPSYRSWVDRMLDGFRAEPEGRRPRRVPRPDRRRARLDGRPVRRGRSRPGGLGRRRPGRPAGHRVAGGARGAVRGGAGGSRQRLHARHRPAGAAGPVPQAGPPAHPRRLPRDRTACPAAAARMLSDETVAIGPVEGLADLAGRRRSPRPSARSPAAPPGDLAVLIASGCTTGTSKASMRSFDTYSAWSAT